MPILGSSSGGGKPDTPTITGVTAGNASVSVAFTEPTYKGKSGSVTYTVTSSPGNITATGSSSPISVTGLTNGTAYTFTINASTPYGSSSSLSAASGSATPVAAYSLIQTFNSSGNFTVPSGITKIAVVLTGGGGSGGYGSTGSRNSTRGGGFYHLGGQGGGGGKSSYFGGFSEYATNAGTVLPVVIGARGNAASTPTPTEGGTTNFGSGLGFATANSGGGNAANNSYATSSAVANGGLGADDVFNSFAENGQSAPTPTNFSINLTGLGNVVYSVSQGGGGGGGGGIIGAVTRPAGTAGAGSGNVSGNGGAGGYQAVAPAGNNANAPGAGGGGGGGGFTSTSGPLAGGAGGLGANGVVYVYGI